MRHPSKRRVGLALLTPNSKACTSASLLETNDGFVCALRTVSHRFTPFRTVPLHSAPCLSRRAFRAIISRHSPLRLAEPQNGAEKQAEGRRGDLGR
eukprot:6205364-Pleurochrysis_carterae.AAC.1